MTYVPVDVPAFGGLNVANDAEDSRGALDIKNLSLSDPSPSRLVTRPGYTLGGTLDLSGVTAIVQQDIVNGSVVVGEESDLRLLAVGGTQSAAKTDFTASLFPWTLVPFGNATSGTLPAATNPSFASNTTGWTPSTSTITRDTGDFDTTPASGRWDNSGASDNLGVGDLLEGTFTGTFLAGTPYTLTVRIKAAAAADISAYWGLQSSGDVGFATWTTTTSYATYTVHWTPSTTHTSGVTLLLGASGTYFWIDSLDVDSIGTLYAADGTNFGALDYDNTFSAPTVATQAAGATTFTAGRAAPKPYTLAVQPKDNRLVACGFSTATYGPNAGAASPSHVYFSQPDNPVSWDETDYVVLSPGDGESIHAACAWGDQLFVFKQSKFFVFYGNSTDADGGTVFNYRTVANAFGGYTGGGDAYSSGIYQGQVCVAPEGVYVITRTGVWLTSGGPPRLVSGALSPLFNVNVTTRGYDGSGIVRLAPVEGYGSGGSFFHEGQAWFSVLTTRSGGETGGWLVLDTASGEWSLFEFADGPKVGCSLAYSGGITFPSGSATVGRKGLLSLDGTATTDNGTAISWYYVAPYSNLGSAVEKRVRQTELHGSGTCDVSWGKDLQAHGYARSVTMLNGRGLDRTAVRGESLSWKVAGSGVFRLNRVIPFLADQRASGVKT